MSTTEERPLVKIEPPTLNAIAEASEALSRTHSLIEGMALRIGVRHGDRENGSRSVSIEVDPVPDLATLVALSRLRQDANELLPEILKWVDGIEREGFAWFDEYALEPA
jgi:hypothetical protein